MKEILKFLGDAKGANGKSSVLDQRLTKENFNSKANNIHFLRSPVDKSDSKLYIEKKVRTMDNSRTRLTNPKLRPNEQNIIGFLPINNHISQTRITNPSHPSKKTLDKLQFSSDMNYKTQSQSAFSQKKQKPLSRSINLAAGKGAAA